MVWRVALIRQRRRCACFNLCLSEKLSAIAASEMRLVCWLPFACAATVAATHSRPARNSTSGREKRYFMYNDDSPLVVELLVFVPLMIFIPSFVSRSPRSFWASPLQGEVEDDVYVDPAYEKQTELIRAVFQLLEMEEIVCHERFLCEMASDPQEFSPIADILLKELRLRRGPLQPSRESLTWRYFVAATRGLQSSGAECQKAYRSCPLAARDVLSLPKLRVWQYFASKTNMRLR